MTRSLLFDRLSTVMRLSRGRIPLVAKTIIARLLTEGIINYTGELSRLVTRVSEVIKKEFSLEDHLNQEVRGLLKQYERQSEPGHVDYQRMFSMVKRQLVKDRGLIL